MKGNWFLTTTLHDWLKTNSHHFFIQSEAKPKPIRSWHTFSRVSCQLRTCVFLTRVLIGSLYLLCPLRKRRMISLFSYPASRLFAKKGGKKLEERKRKPGKNPRRAFTQAIVFSLTALRTTVHYSWILLFNYFLYDH